jgi:hypothetical protein
MTKEFDTDDFGQTYFENLINKVGGHTDWSYSDRNNRSVTEAAEAASGFSSSNEVLVDHAETDGELYLMMPDFGSPVMAARGVLKQPLDGTQRQEPYPNSFGVKIMEAYRSAVEGRDAEYLDIDPNPINILSVGVSFDYDDDTLESSLDEASEISADIQEVNDEVIKVLDQV